MKFLVWNACSFFFLAVNQLQKTGSSVHNQSLREKHAFSVEFLLVYRSVLRWRSNTHVGFLFWLWPNQKEPLSNLKAVIKPTWTKQRSTEISWNFTTVCTQAGDTKHYLFRVWQRKLDSHCLTSFWHEHLGFFWPVSTWCERRNFRKMSMSFSTRFSKKILTKWKIKLQERLD